MAAALASVTGGARRPERAQKLTRRLPACENPAASLAGVGPGAAAGVSVFQTG